MANGKCCVFCGWYETDHEIPQNAITHRNGYRYHLDGCPGFKPPKETRSERKNRLQAEDDERWFAQNDEAKESLGVIIFQRLGPEIGHLTTLSGMLGT
jgi:hypothetical protein